MPVKLRCLDLGLGLTRSASTEEAEEISTTSPSYWKLKVRLHMQVAYVAGLGLAFGINAVTHLGQPAVRIIPPRFRRKTLCR